MHVPHQCMLFYPSKINPYNKFDPEKMRQMRKVNLFFCDKFRTKIENKQTKTRLTNKQTKNIFVFVWSICKMYWMEKNCRKQWTSGWSKGKKWKNLNVVLKFISFLWCDICLCACNLVMSRVWSRKTSRHSFLRLFFFFFFSFLLK